MKEKKNCFRDLAHAYEKQLALVEHQAQEPSGQEERETTGASSNQVAYCAPHIDSSRVTVCSGTLTCFDGYGGSCITPVVDEIQMENCADLARHNVVTGDACAPNGYTGRRPE
jgi:hypothetical protein